MQGLSTSHSPSASVVVPYYIFAAVSFLVFSFLSILSSDAFLGHYFQPKLLALTHMAALGWGTMIIFGALHQFLPVILGVPVYSEKIAKIIFWIFAAGIICLVFSFWKFYVGLHLQVAAVLIFLAFTLFLLNIYKTAREADKWTIEADFILCSSVWLFLTGLIGLLMAFNFRYVFLPKSHLTFLKIHAHLGIAGWFVLLIMGVASRLIPMFLLSHNLNSRKLTCAFYLVNAGLVAFSADMYFTEGSRLLPLYAIVIVSGIICFISFLAEAYRKRMRRQLDISLKQSFMAFLLFLLPAFIGVLISFDPSLPAGLIPGIYLVYGIGIFVGFISTLILGQTFKTLPFIIWLHKYRKQAGKPGTPLPRDMFSEKLAVGQYTFHVSSVALLMAGVLASGAALIKTGTLLLFISAALYNINVIKILFYSSKNIKPVLHAGIQRSE